MFDFIKLLSQNLYSVGCATLCPKREVMLQANQDSWLKAKAGARIPVKTINKSTHTNIFIYSIFLFRKKLELCRTAMLYVVCCFLLEEIHFMEHFPLALCTVKLGNKELFDKEQIGIKEPFPLTNLPFIS